MKHLSYLIALTLFASCKSETDSKTNIDEQKTKHEQQSDAKVAKQNRKQTSTLRTASEDLSSEERSLKVQERPPQTPKPKRSKYPVAETLPDKPGYVTNPVTGGEVDVRGIPPGSLVIDPKDPDKNKFRTPVSK